MKPDLSAMKLAAPDVPERLVAEHLARLEVRYFERFDGQAVTSHLRGLSELSQLLPVNVLVSPGAAGLVECTILGFDAPGLFSLVTGVLMSLGFSVLSGDVYTYGPPVGPPGSRRADPYRRRRIVDVFIGR